MEAAGQPRVGGVGGIGGVGVGVSVGGLVVEDEKTPPAAGDYVTLGGLRLVKPYHFDFKCHVKARHEGRGIVDVFATEFPARTRRYYEAALAAGRLRVEGHGVAADTPLRSGMCMRHFIHRHEPPVPAGDVQARAASARSPPPARLAASSPSLLLKPAHTLQSTSSLPPIRWWA
jgi:hypothetical protein